MTLHCHDMGNKVKDNISWQPTKSGGVGFRCDGQLEWVMKVFEAGIGIVVLGRNNLGSTLSSKQIEQSFHHGTPPL